MQLVYFPAEYICTVVLSLLTILLVISKCFDYFFSFDQTTISQLISFSWLIY